MRVTKLNTGAIRHSLALFCVIVLLSSCGLAKSRGSLDAGAKYQASGQYRAAYIEAKKVLQRDSSNGKAWLLLGQASLMLGDPQDALNSLEKARADGVPEALWAVPMGRVLLVTEQYDKLLKTVSSEGSLEPQVRARVEALRGDAYRGLKQVDQAQQAYKSALALDPQSAQALVGLAKLAFIANDPVSAGKYLQQALAASPESPQAWVATGDLAFDNHDFAGAEADYKKVLGFKTPDWVPQEHFYALTRLANVQAQQNQLGEALATIQTLEKMSPQQPYPHYLHALVLYKQGQFDGATSQLQEVLKVLPDNHQAQLLMGAVNYAQANYSQAEMYLSNIMGTEPKNVEARKLLALTFYREGRSNQALDMLRPAVPGTPSDAELLALLQRAATEGIGSPRSSVSRTGAGNPPGSVPDSELTRAGQAMASGNNAEAIRLLQEMPAADASIEGRRTAMLVAAQVRDKHPAEAVKAAAAYAAKNPGESGAHLLYGTALIAAGNRTEARTQYAEAYKLDPKSSAAILNLASLDSIEGHYQDAATRYETVLKQDPHNAVAMTSLGRLAVLQGNKADAIKWYMRAISAAPKSVPAYTGLITLYTESRQFDEAVTTASQLAKANPDSPDALNILGAAELNAGSYRAALEPLQQAVKLVPQQPVYRINLARAQILNKDTRAAKANLDQVIKAGADRGPATVLLAFLKVQDHDLPGAVSLAQALQKEPATAVAGFALEGDLYMANKSYAQAAQAYQHGLNIQYERPLVIKNFQALSEGNAKDPQRVLQGWLTKHPDDAAMRLILAQYYLDHAQNTLAADEYERVLEKYPSNVGALNNLAWTYTEQHNPKALALAARAYKLAPDSPGVADTYGWALIAGNQAKAALPILAQAAKAAPKAASIQYHLAVAQSRTGDRAGARSTLETLRKSGADFTDKQAAAKLYQELSGTAAPGQPVRRP